MQGAGRSIVNGTKQGYASAKSGLQKWLDPAASETASNLDKVDKELGVDRQASSVKGPKTVVTGHTGDDDSTTTTRTAQGSNKSTSTRVGTRPVGTNVADSFVIE